jgi:hypothetical protein
MSLLQVAMSRFEAEEYINDRYKAMEERLAVSGVRWMLLEREKLFRHTDQAIVCPPADCAQEAEQAPHPCGEGGWLQA